MDATFWALVALILFFVVIAYFKVPATITRSLDERAARIRNDLEEARRLREEAQQLLQDYQRRRAEAEREAADITAAAQREAARLVEEARARSQEYVTRRTALAEQKIGQAERDAIAEVKAAAVDIAVQAARKIIGERADGESNARLFQNALGEVRTKLN